MNYFLHIDDNVVKMIHVHIDPQKTDNADRPVVGDITL